MNKEYIEDEEQFRTFCSEYRVGGDNYSRSMDSSNFY